MKADLHIHTNSSDGLFPVPDILSKARDGKLSVISITDHDNVNAYDFFTHSEVRQEISMDASGLYVISGIEISCDYNGEEIHVLGYFLDPNADVLRDLEMWMRKSRKQRLEAMLEKLKNIAMPITENEILAFSKNAPIGRPHIAAALCKKGYCQTIRDAFDLYLEKGKLIYCEREKPTIEKAINIIHSAGGLAFLAHPGLISKESILMSVLKLEFDGLEVWHNSHDQRTSDYFYSFCLNNKKLMSGGSDFHGLERDARLGAFSINTAFVTKIMERVRETGKCNLIFAKYVDM